MVSVSGKTLVIVSITTFIACRAHHGSRCCQLFETIEIACNIETVINMDTAYLFELIDVHAEKTGYGISASCACDKLIYRCKCEV